MMISILTIAIFAGAVNALWFGLTSGSLLNRSDCILDDWLYRLVLMAIFAAVRYDFLCNAAINEQGRCHEGPFRPDATVFPLA